MTKQKSRNRFFRIICTCVLTFILLMTSIFADSGPEVVTSGEKKGRLFIDGKDYNSCDHGTFTFGLLNVAHTQTLTIDESL